MTRSARIRNLLFGVGICTALAFGASAAAANPAPRPTSGNRQMCPFFRIYEDCVSCCFSNGHPVAVWDAHTGACSCGV